MNIECYEEVKDLTEKLIKIPSVTRRSGEETACAKAIYEYYMQLRYFKKHKDCVRMIKTVNDDVERHSVYACVKGKKGESNRTIILLSHLDTVGIDDFGSIREFALDPEKLPEHLLELNITEELRNDILSGEYMFGRGSLDMKSGAAEHMVLIKYFSEHLEDFSGNIIAYAACDEEVSSTGILTGLKEFKKLEKSENLEYVACINSDCSMPYSIDDNNRYIYYGSVGKMLPAYYVVGKETHAGDVFSGFDPNLLLSELTKAIDFNIELCDKADGEVTNPPVTLKQTDLKEEYNVQTAFAAYAYYNVLSISKSPIEILSKFEQIAKETFNFTLEELDSRYKSYCKFSNKTYSKLCWKERVYTWQSLKKQLYKENGNKFIENITKFAEDLNYNNPHIDLRVFAVKIIEEAWKWMKDKSPAVIVFFSSTFIPRVRVGDEDSQDIRLKNAVQRAICSNQSLCGENKVIERMYFPYISDSSFVNLSDSAEDIDFMGENMPAWKTKYFFDSEDVSELGVPVVNIGVHGKDPHKISERVHMEYSFKVVPNITYDTIIDLL